MLAQSAPGTYTCGTRAAGWTTATLPTVPGYTLDIQVTVRY